MENVQYDPTIIQKFANDLYSQANGLVAMFTVTGVLGGGFIGHELAQATRHETFMYAAVGAAVLGLVGYTSGTSKALSLRVQAQTALCQVMIENNTRATTKLLPPPPPVSG